MDWCSHWWFAADPTWWTCFRALQVKERVLERPSGESLRQVSPASTAVSRAHWPEGQILTEEFSRLRNVQKNDCFFLVGREIALLLSLVRKLHYWTVIESGTKSEFPFGIWCRQNSFDNRGRPSCLADRLQNVDASYCRSSMSLILQGVWLLWGSGRWWIVGGSGRLHWG